MENDVRFATQSQCLTEDGQFFFAMLPVPMLGDPMLKSSDICVAAAILSWLADRPSGWVSVKTIAATTGMERRNVQVCLSRLIQHKWFACAPTETNDTHREFVALWRTEDGFKVLTERIRGGAPPCAGGAHGCAPNESRDDEQNEYSIHASACAGASARFSNSGASVVGAENPFAFGDFAPRFSNPSFDDCVDAKQIHANGVAEGERNLVGGGAGEEMCVDGPVALAARKSDYSLREGCGEGTGDAFQEDPETAQMLASTTTAIQTAVSLPGRVPGVGEAIKAAAEKMAELLIDDHSKAFHRKTLKRVRAGEVDFSWVIESLRLTMKAFGRVDCAAPYYTTTLKEGSLEKQDRDMDRRMIEERALQGATR